ncbi:MAG: hypothetical protein ABIA02_04310 [Candidatus Falkowbacteria bacterium]
MIEKESAHLISILESTKKAVEVQDVLKLRELSNQTIHSASVEQDADSVAVAVMVYALSKIIERRYHENFKGCDSFCKSSLMSIDKAIRAIEKNDEAVFSKSLEEINSSIGKLSPDLKKYVGDVFRKASINKASKIYEHGISMEQTAQLLGLTLYELASYAGQTPVSEAEINKTMTVKQRIKLAERMFG